LEWIFLKISLNWWTEKLHMATLTKVVVPFAEERSIARSLVKAIVAILEWYADRPYKGPTVSESRPLFTPQKHYFSASRPHFC
jgi:hypothetical protein